MKTRIISACIMLPLLVLVYLGGWVYLGGGADRGPDGRAGILQGL